MMGDLQNLIDSGEYLPLRAIPIFESNFIQVNRRGESICVHNRPNYVTVGVCASSPCMKLPNLMLLAHPAPVPSQESIPVHSSSSCLQYSKDELVLSRFLPLKFVEISIHSVVKKRIKLKLVSGRAYYLELCGPSQKQALLFERWKKLIDELQSKSSDESIHFKKSDMQVRPRTVYNSPQKTTKQEQPVRKPKKKQEQEREIPKQISSKRVSISESFVGPTEHIGKSKSQAVVSSHGIGAGESIVDSRTQKTQQQESKKNVSKKKSREREPFAHSGTTLHTSAPSQ